MFWVALLEGDLERDLEGLERNVPLVVDGLRGEEVVGGVNPDRSHVNGIDDSELRLFVAVTGLVLTTFGGRTEVELGVIIVVMYARMTSTVGAFVTVTMYPL